MMRVKWTTGNKQVMRQLVDENKAKPKATKKRITTKSREDAWCRARAMKNTWPGENNWYRTGDMKTAWTDDK